jgi:hypothetical protein
MKDLYHQRRLTIMIYFLASSQKNINKKGRNGEKDRKKG